MFQSRDGAARSEDSRACPLVRLRRIRSLVCRALPDLLGSSGSQLPSVSRGGFWLWCSTVPWVRLDPVHPSVSRSPLQSSFVASLSALGRPPTTGFGPHRGVTKSRPQTRGFPLPAPFRPQVFSTSRRFSPRIRFRAYFIPNHVQGSPGSGSCSPRTAPLPRRDGLPPCRSHLRPLADHPCGRTVATAKTCGSEALLHARIRASAAAVKPRRWPIPSSCSTPPGLRTLPWILLTRTIRPWCCTSPVLAYRVVLTFGVLPATHSVSTVTGGPTCASFLPAFPRFPLPSYDVRFRFVPARPSALL